MIIDGENVKLVFYWSHDLQYLANLALHGFGTEDMSANKRLVFGDSITLAKYAHEVIEVCHTL